MKWKHHWKIESEIIKIFSNVTIWLTFLLYILLEVEIIEKKGYKSCKCAFFADSTERLSVSTDDVVWYFSEWERHKDGIHLVSNSETWWTTKCRRFSFLYEAGTTWNAQYLCHLIWWRFPWKISWYVILMLWRLSPIEIKSHIAVRF